MSNDLIQFKLATSNEPNYYSAYSGMITNFECCKNKPPSNFVTPFYETKYASNNINQEYGNNKVTYSSMRQNYKERIMSIMNDTTNETGISAGGGEYVVPIVLPTDLRFYKSDCSNYGYQKLNKAYGPNNNGSCKIHYEDY